LGEVGRRGRLGGFASFGAVVGEAVDIMLRSGEFLEAFPLRRCVGAWSCGWRGC
jgi:hypothetical protein